VFILYENLDVQARLPSEARVNPQVLRGKLEQKFNNNTYIAPTNTYSLAALKKDKTVNKIVFDSSKEDAFIVHLKNGRKVKFHCTPEGLYAYGPNNKFHNNPYHALFS
jgi:hypothetical protein